MKRILFLLVVILTVAFTASAQEYDGVKLTVGVRNLNVANMNLPGIHASGDIKIASFGRWRLGGLIDGSYQRDITRTLDRYQLMAGPQLSYLVGEEERLILFVRTTGGITRFNQVNKQFADFNRGTIGIGGGVDVHMGDHWFVRAGGDLQYIDRRPVRYTGLFVDVGYRFGR